MSIISLIKQHDVDSLSTTDELTFVYPFIVPKSTDPKLVSSLRSFMMVQYLSQIKITNAIKITTSLARPKKQSNIPRVNPTDFTPSDSRAVQIKIGDQEPQPFSLSNIREDIAVDLTKQEFIDKFRDMLKQIVKTEPKFKNLDPIVTTLTLENLLTIPVIAASKVENISNDILYWILFAAMGQRIRIDSVGNLKRIESVLRSIPAGSYSDLLDPTFIDRIESNNTKFQKDIQEVNRLKSLNPSQFRGSVSLYNKMIRDPLDQALTTWGKTLDLKQWDDRTGIKSSIDDKLSASAISTLGSSQVVLANANTLFSSLMANYVLHLLQSVLHSLVSNDEVDVANIISNFGKVIIDNTNRLVSTLMLGMLNAIQSQKISSSDVVFKLLETSCVANNSINVAGLLSKLEGLSFSVRGDTNTLADFTSGLVGVSASMSPLSIVVKKSISDLLKFDDGSASVNLTGSSVDSDELIENYRKSVEKELHDRVFKRSGVFDSIDSTFKSNRFLTLTRNTNASKFINTVSSALSEVVQFLGIYTFYSYFCEYTGELAAEVEVKRQGVMTFPNYCLVVPIEMLRPIYAVLASRNFKNILDDPDKFDSDIQVAGRVSEFKLVSTIKDKLAIQNIIVIDHNTIYYKWLFSSSVQKISTSALSSYVKTQTEFLKAY